MAVELVEEPQVDDWSAGIRCRRCDAVYSFTGEDLEIDGFKISGYFFTGTAVCVDKAFIECPSCKRCDVFERSTLPSWLWTRLPKSS